MKFLDYCIKNKIIVLRFPSHATHTLQPLNVVVFKSLSSAYSRELEQFRIQSHRLISIAKQDFFSVFWKAWESTFQLPLVLKSFKATGLSPPNPDVILERFDSDSSGSDSDDSESPLTNWQQLNRQFREVVKDLNDRQTQELNLAFHHLYSFAEINKHATNKLKQALLIKTKQKKPSKALQDPDSNRESGRAK
jgi:hypothetical protein